MIRTFLFVQIDRRRKRKGKRRIIPRTFFFFFFFYFCHLSFSCLFSIWISRWRRLTRHVFVVFLLHLCLHFVHHLNHRENCFNIFKREKFSTVNVNDPHWIFSIPPFHRMTNKLSHGSIFFFFWWPFSVLFVVLLLLFLFTFVSSRKISQRIWKKIKSFCFVLLFSFRKLKKEEKQYRNYLMSDSLSLRNVRPTLIGHYQVRQVKLELKMIHYYLFIFLSVHRDKPTIQHNFINTNVFPNIFSHFLVQIVTMLINGENFVRVLLLLHLHILLFYQQRTMSMLNVQLRYFRHRRTSIQYVELLRL